MTPWLHLLGAISWSLQHIGHWLENTGLMRALKAITPIITVTGITIALILFYLTLEDRKQSEIARAWQIIAASPGTEGGNIGQKEAVEFLNAKGIALSQINLSRALLRHVNLANANLTRANFEKAILEYANLRGANLWRARLMRAFLTGANLQDARLEGAFLMLAQLEQANLVGADLTQANLSGANLTGANVTAKQLSLACADPRIPPTIEESVKPPRPWPQPCQPWQ